MPASISLETAFARAMLCYNNRNDEEVDTREDNRARPTRAYLLKTTLCLGGLEEDC